MRTVAAPPLGGPGLSRRIQPRILLTLGVMCLAFTAAAMAFVDWNPAGPDMTVLESEMLAEDTGMTMVEEAKSHVQELSKKYEKTKLAVRSARLKQNLAKQKESTVQSEANKASEKVDREDALISKYSADAETQGDEIGELKLRAQEHRHAADREARRSDTALRRERRERGTLHDVKARADHMSSEATAELKKAMERKASVAELVAIGKKHLERALQIKQNVEGKLAHKLAELRERISKSKRVALHAAEHAKAAGEKYARLESRIEKHKSAAALAQQAADAARLAADSEGKKASLQSDKVADELKTARDLKHQMSDQLQNAAGVTKKGTTLHTTKKPVHSLDSHAHTSAAGPSSHSAAHGSAAVSSQEVAPSAKDREAQRDAAAAAARIHALNKAKRAADRVVQREKEEEAKIKHLLAKHRAEAHGGQSGVMSNADEVRRRAARRMRDLARERRDEEAGDRPDSPDNFSEAMKFLHNRHLDAATGVDDHGRNSVGQKEGGDAPKFVGINGRSPQLDEMAKANLEQYEEDESQLNRANYHGIDGQDGGPTDRNPF